jgi:predicted nucleic acid-binding protein
VVDASIAVQWIAREAGSEAAATLLTGQHPLLAPDIMPVEVANALWKKVHRGDLPEEMLAIALTRLLASDLMLSPTVSLLLRATRLAVDTAHPVYDCVYLALADQQGALLATADARLAQTARACGLRVWRPRGG